MINKYTDMSFENLEVSNSFARVTLEHIDEGNDGDFDINDPDDIRLIRFSVDKKEDGYWEGVEEASYCTEIPIDAPQGQLEAIARSILEEVTGPIQSGVPIKRLCERLSWMEV